jgi:hypothetical protein
MFYYQNHLFLLRSMLTFELEFGIRNTCLYQARCKIPSVIEFVTIFKQTLIKCLRLHTILFFSKSRSIYIFNIL